MMEDVIAGAIYNGFGLAVYLYFLGLIPMYLISYIRS